MLKNLFSSPRTSVAGSGGLGLGIVTLISGLVEKDWARVAQGAGELLLGLALLLAKDPAKS